ncbi:MAG: selenium-dependent molybdenum cofactor biosynthesis protein YqeB [Hespellia sp.]|nr:selenium-dependent molybdenum cofactor biosynthesis protein YqeB [Hespellia sp.]
MSERIIVRGGGDLATGTIYKLYKSGFQVLVLETDYPSAIRRNVAFSEAVYEGRQQVEDVTCYRADTLEEAEAMLAAGRLVLLVDPAGKSIPIFQPFAVVDAILAKKNLGTDKSMAELTVGVGPGFTAGVDVDVVVETKRGHQLGRLLYEGAAIANTGIPGIVGGYGRERVIHSPAQGTMENICHITDMVEANQIIALIHTKEGNVPVKAGISGLLRGFIRDGYPVTKGFKIADVDPRADEYQKCFTISDKARCIGGGVLEAILHALAEKERGEKKEG